MTDPNTNIIAFNTISDFICELGNSFGSKQKSVALYARLIEKTTISHKEIINKHVDKFRTFCVANRNSIKEKKHVDFVQPRVSYSERVYIDMKHLFNIADNSEKRVMWKYLLTISAILDREGGAKEVLKSAGKEGEFIEQAFDDIKSSLDSTNVEGSNPMAVAMGLMGSGVFQNLLNGVTKGVDDGSLDLNKLMSTVQGMIATTNPSSSTTTIEEVDAENP